jgi:hypothetical protein
VPAGHGAQQALGGKRVEGERGIAAGGPAVASARLEPAAAGLIMPKNG